MENQHVTEQLSDWEQVESPFPTNDENPIVVGDEFFGETSVFPPGNHENLPVPDPQDDNEDRHSREHDSPRGDGANRWTRARLVVTLRNAIFRVLGGIRKCYVTFDNNRVGLLLSFAGLVMVYYVHRRVLVWWQRRLMQIESGNESLMNLMREKDKKINQLLLQSAQMNEILLARRKVHVIRVRR